MAKLVEQQAEIIRDLSGHLLDATYSLLGLPGLANGDRFLLVIDGSFFCSVEQNKPIDRKQFDGYLHKVFSSFLLDEWRHSFKYLEEDKDTDPAIPDLGVAVGNQKYQAMVQNFCDHWHSLMVDLDAIINRHRPKMVRMPPRITDTLLRQTCGDEMAAFMRQPEQMNRAAAAMPLPWEATFELHDGPVAKFVMYRARVPLFRQQDEMMNAYVIFFLPHRVLRDIPDLYAAMA